MKTYKTKNDVKIILSMIALIFLVSIVGKMDFEDEQMAFTQYCDDVSAGIYPDYKKQLNYCK